MSDPQAKPGAIRAASTRRSPRSWTIRPSACGARSRFTARSSRSSCAATGVQEIFRELSDLVGGPPQWCRSTARSWAPRGWRRSGCPTPDGVLLHVSDGAARFGSVTVSCEAVLISAGLRVYGHVVAFAGAPSGADNRLALEHTATVAALAITKQMEIQAVEDKYRSDLMHDLLTHVDDRDDALRRASSFGWDVQRRLIAIVVRLDDRPDLVVPDEVNRQPALAKALREPVLDRDPRAAVVQSSHEVVILTQAFEGERGRAEADHFVRRLVKQVSKVVGTTVSAGQSRPLEDLADIRTAYAQASRALAIGRQVHGRGAVQHFLDLGAYRLLWQVQDRSELRAFAREVLGKLAEDDAESVRLERGRSRCSSAPTATSPRRPGCCTSTTTPFATGSPS